MLRAVPMVISKKNYPEVFAFAEEISALAKALYNAALFRIRQVFTGWNKEIRSANEEEVFRELEVTKTVYPGISFRRVLSYHNLEKIMRATRNPDFFAGLPMQTAQAVVREAVQNFKDWLAALRAYKKDPSRFTGKPAMPHYKKTARSTFKVTNQDAVLYLGKRPGDCLLKLPGLRERFPVSGISKDSRLKEMTFKPYYGRYLMAFVMEGGKEPAHRADMPNTAGIDFGTDNIAAIVCTDGSSAVYKGGAVLSENRLFAKKRAGAVSILTQGKKNSKADSAHLSRLSLHHDCFMRDQMHRISTSIIRYCIAHKAGTLILGVNKGWKQNASLGKKNNQKFVGVPHDRLRFLLTYKALEAGITVIEQEESYTSRADVTASDPLPSYGECGPFLFSGKRVCRGLYRCHDGQFINADCNGAANIIRKAFPDAWKETTDFRFLASPQSIGFKDLYSRTA